MGNVWHQRFVQTFKMRRIGLFLGLLAAATSALACYNDVDTNLTELRDNLDVTLAVAGRFTIYPKEYYEKRIWIQSDILAKNPNNLEAYDNIAVAFDRIGDSANAMKWIHEKRKHLGANPGNQQLYSTEANEGTILIVRWIREHKPGDVADAVAAEKCIAKALQINPNAHFGREFAQLYSIRALIQCGKNDDWKEKFSETLISVADKDHIDHKKLRFGIAGMMVLGAAWTMPPMIQAIANLVPEEQQIVALCEQRMLSLDWSNPELTFDDFPIKRNEKLNPVERPLIHRLLSNAQEFQINRQKWVSDQVAKGRYPDVDKDFWEGFKDVPPIPKSDYVVIRKKRIWEQPGGIMQLFILVGAGSAILVAIGYYIYRQMKLKMKGF